VLRNSMPRSMSWLICWGVMGEIEGWRLKLGDSEAAVEDREAADDADGFTLDAFVRLGFQAIEAFLLSPPISGELGVVLPECADLGFDDALFGGGDGGFLGRHGGGLDGVDYQMRRLASWSRW